MNPATDDAKWYLAYEFYDSAGALIGDVQAADPADGGVDGGVGGGHEQVRET